MDTETRKAIEEYMTSDDPAVIWHGGKNVNRWLRQCLEEIDKLDSSSLKEYTRLQNQCNEAIQGWLETTKARDALESKLKACMEALEPFAQSEFSRELGGNVQGDKSPIFERNGQRLTLGDFRRAKAALEQVRGK